MTQFESMECGLVGLGIYIYIVFTITYNYLGEAKEKAVNNQSARMTMKNCLSFPIITKANSSFKFLVEVLRKGWKSCPIFPRIAHLKFVHLRLLCLSFVCFTHRFVALKEKMSIWESLNE